MKYVRRLMWFLASRLVVVSVVLILIILAFYMAMNAANVYILLDDGMNARTNTILTREDADLLNNYFRKDFLDSDAALNIGLSTESPYINYKIDSFEDDLTLEWVWSWPWEDTATATIVYRVPEIKGAVVAGKTELVTNNQLSADPPAWQGGRYRMTLYRVNGQWKIAGMQQTQIILEPTRQPTPAPSASPAA